MLSNKSTLLHVHSVAVTDFFVEYSIKVWDFITFYFFLDQFNKK